MPVVGAGGVHISSGTVIIYFLSSLPPYQHPVSAAKSELIEGFRLWQLLEPRVGLAFRHPIEEPTHFDVGAVSQELFHDTRRQRCHALQKLVGVFEGYRFRHLL